ncbi:YrbL family protein [Marinobacterium mangrovicola]|uniref:PhoP regulatory network protein YrbL n=1 Tax=Marinobacterium mangrovicola TaxID=1476959 RepID=A0A4R1G6C2_9GAMM|nr:YrbL family protein [Marinobacterium mangrovicola]TCK03058.1 PhoP regulatory network protein YrbL [Marinobacterium mangrovicola]
MKLTLSTQKPLASGGEKNVYQHSEMDELLIKVWRPRYFEKLERKNSFYNLFRRLPKYTGCLKELSEHLYVREWGEDTRFVQNIVGIADTDLGVGLVVEKVARGSGELAQSLNELLYTGSYNEVHEKAVAELVSWLRSTGLIIRDLNLRNLVWDELGNRFVIIDGLGGRAGFSFRSLCRWYNKRSNNKRANKLLVRIERAKKRREDALRKAE